MNQSCHTHEWVMSHTWVGMFYMTYMSHVTRVFESRHAYEWVTSHIFMSCHTKSRHRAWTITSRMWSHVTHMRESCRTHTSESCYTYRVLSHIKTSPCHTYEWVLSHIFMSCYTKRCRRTRTITSRVWSHVTHMNASCHTYEWVMSCYTKSRRRTRTTNCRVSSHVTHMNESCHIYSCHMARKSSHVTHMNESCHTYDWVMSHIWMSHVTYIHVIWHEKVASDPDNYLSRLEHEHRMAQRHQIKTAQEMMEEVCVCMWMCVCVCVCSRV